MLDIIQIYWKDFLIFYLLFEIYKNYLDLNREVEICKKEINGVKESISKKEEIYKTRLFEVKESISAEVKNREKEIFSAIVDLFEEIENLETEIMEHLNQKKEISELKTFFIENLVKR